MFKRFTGISLTVSQQAVHGLLDYKKVVETCCFFGVKFPISGKADGCRKCYYINAQVKLFIHVFCRNRLVTLLLHCLRGVGLSGSPRKRMVRISPGGLGSRSHCSVF